MIGVHPVPRRRPATRRRARTLGPGLGILLAALVLPLACSRSVEDRLAEVRAMHDIGEYRESIDPLREILAEAPDHAEGNLRLGLALVRTRQANRAVWPLERAARSPEHAVEASLALASLYLPLQDYDRAVAAADRVLAVDPDHRAARSLRAKIYLEAKRQEEALADIDRLLLDTPDDLELLFTRAVALGELKRIDESEAAHRRFLEAAGAAGQPAIHARACAMLALFFRDYAEDPETAERELLACREEHPDDPTIHKYVLEMYEQSDRTDEALAVAREHFERNPEDLSRRVALSNRLRNAGEKEQAQRLLLEAVETSGGVGERLAMVEFYRAEGEAERALATLDTLIADFGGLHSDEMRLTYVDLLLDADRLDEAEGVIGEIEERVYAQLARGRLLVQRGDPDSALELLDPAVQQWPDNAGARYVAGLAAYRTGAAEKAIAHLREAVRADSGSTDAALLLARMLLERGELDEAARFAHSFVRSRGKSRSEGYVVWARALTALEEFEGARTVVGQLADADFPVEAAVERAAIERAAADPAAAARVIEESGLDLAAAGSEPALRSLAEDLVSLERSEEALARVEAAVGAHPDSPALHELLGSLRYRRGERAEAREAFEAALALDARHARALLGVATLEAVEGNRARAVELFDRADDADAGDGSAAYAAAQLTLGAGKTEEAEQRLRAVVRKHPGQAGARNDLAWLLAQSGRELDRALALAEEAVRIDPGAPLLDTLGYVRLKRGEGPEAAEAFRRALEAEPGAPSVRYRLALALALAGDTESALAALREALAAGPFPEAEAARRELARLEQR